MKRNMVLWLRVHDHVALRSLLGIYEIWYGKEVKRKNKTVLCVPSARARCVEIVKMTLMINGLSVQKNIIDSGSDV